MKKFVCIAMAALLLAGCGSSAAEENETQSREESTAGESAVSESTIQESQESAAQTTQENTETESGETGSGSGTSISAGEYTYHTESMEKSWKTEGGTTACTVRFEYPVFEGGSEGEKNINDFFEEWIDDKMEAYENDEDSIVNIALKYQTEIEGEQSTEDGENILPASEEDFNVGGVVVRGGIISVFMESYSYEGGAHGMPGRSNYLFDKNTGKEAQLMSLVKISEEELNEKVRGLFLELVKNSEEGFFEDAQETLNNKMDFADNYYFSEDGVVFYTTPYEIAPYAAGYTEVTVPFEELGL